MNLFHRHQWELSHVQYTPPFPFDQLGLRSIQNASATLLLELTLGSTTIIERCERCGKYETHRVVGRAYQEETE